LVDQVTIRIGRPSRTSASHWPGLPWWVNEPLRIAIFMLPFVPAYYVWQYFL